MSEEALVQAIGIVVAIPDEAIRQVIMAYGGALSLADKMIARKQQMAQRLRHSATT